MNLIRGKSTDQGTPGKLDFGGLVTIELPWKNNEPFVSCIPTGVYPLKLYASPKFNCDVIEIIGVPNRDKVEFHWGTWAGDIDKDYLSNSDGCVIVGSKAGMLAGQMAVLRSRDAFNMLIAAFKAGLIVPTLTILYSNEEA